MRLLRNHGLINCDEALIWGYNSRLDTIQAAIAINGLKEIEKITQKRISNALFYDENLCDLKKYIKIPKRPKNVRQVFHTYIIEVKKRDELLSYLKTHGIETKIHYPIPIHLQKAARNLGYREGDFPVCEEQAKKIISLPIHQYLDKKDLLKVVFHIHKFYKK